MPVGIIPDISEQMCIGCALCVEICTSLGPDVLRVKPVEGWKRGKAFYLELEVSCANSRCLSELLEYSICSITHSLYAISVVKRAFWHPDL